MKDERARRQAAQALLLLRLLETRVRALEDEAQALVGT